ncbi:MAG: Na/Pi cotransporter family protein [Gammaproteobacteria bacterium]|nr:Na/Pi cotransporter family protein [Gammaproteobacteria bacterium]
MKLSLLARTVSSRLIVSFICVACPIAALAAAAPVAEHIAWLHLLMVLFGGLAFFLFGMEQMSDALKSALGEQMKDLLARLTRNRFTGAITGAFVTAVVQSSSITTVLVVGFVSAGMMSMAQSIGVIMGANVGTTITAQIVAFKVEEAALWMVFFGFLMMFAGKRESVKHYGSMLMGLGLIFYGMGLMGDAMTPLRSYEPFLQLMTRMDNPLLAIIIGALFTALVQSSSATTAIVITMAGQGLISLEAGIALAFGANIGTCITAQLAALGKPREALRAAVVHLLFNVGGVLIWLPFISVLATLVVDVSPMHPELEGTARMAAEVPRQIANAHTMFNIINTLLFLGFTGYMARFVERLIPEKVEVEKEIIRPKFLDDTLIETPALALQRVQLEIAHMGEIVYRMFSDLREAMLKRERTKLEEVQKMDDQIDVLEGEIFRYLGEVSARSLTEQESADVALAMKVADEFESVGDVIESNLTSLGYMVLDENIQPSDAMRYLFDQLGDKISAAIDATVRGVRDADQRAAGEVLTMKADIDHLINQALELQSSALAEVGPDQIKVIRMEMTAVENLKRIYTYLKRIAREIVPAEVGV